MISKINLCCIINEKIQDGCHIATIKVYLLPGIYYLSFTLKCVVYTLIIPKVHPPPPDASLIDTFLLICVPYMEYNLTEKIYIN